MLLKNIHFLFNGKSLDLNPALKLIAALRVLRQFTRSDSKRQIRAVTDWTHLVTCSMHLRWNSNCRSFAKIRGRTSSVKVVPNSLIWYPWIGIPRKRKSTDAVQILERHAFLTNSLQVAGFELNTSGPELPLLTTKPPPVLLLDSLWSFTKDVPEGQPAFHWPRRPICCCRFDLFWDLRLILTESRPLFERGKKQARARFLNLFVFWALEENFFSSLVSKISFLYAFPWNKEILLTN